MTRDLMAELKASLVAADDERRRRDADRRKPDPEDRCSYSIAAGGCPAFCRCDKCPEGARQPRRNEAS